MSFYDALDAAAAKTTCNILDTGGQSLIGYGAVSIAAGGAGIVPMTAGAIALLTKNLLCDPGWDPDTPQANPIPGVDCTEAADGTPFSIYWEIPSLGFKSLILTSAIRITGFEKTPNQPEGSNRFNVNAIAPDGSPTFGQFNNDPGSIITTTIAQGNCGGPSIGPEWNPPGPTTYTDPTTSCEYIVNFQGFASFPDTSVKPVYKISPGANGTLRAGGGAIRGCNFDPVIYVGGPPGLPPYVGPWNPIWPDGPSGGTPPWLDFVNDLVGGILGNAIYDELKKLTETKYPASSKEIYAACEFKEDGTPETYSVNFPEEAFNERVLTALDAIVDFQQQFFLWKTPVCSTAPMPLTGEAVSINFISEQPSPVTGDYLKKLFTYFDQSGRSLADHVEHWRDFSWEAGPVVVSCIKTKLGKPQVWANSVDEAKRVINHAAAIAGVDMTDAEWLVGTPKSARYGQPGTMRVHRTVDGLLGVTKRDGPSGFPPALP